MKIEKGQTVMKRMVCEQCGQPWQVEKVGVEGWRLRESPAPWGHSWLISAESPCCPFDGGALAEGQHEESASRAFDAAHSITASP